MTTKISRKLDATMIQNDARKKDIAKLWIALHRLSNDLHMIEQVTQYLLDQCPGVAQRKRARRQK